MPATFTTVPPTPGPELGDRPVTTGPTLVTVHVNDVEPDCFGMALSVAVTVTG